MASLVWRGGRRGGGDFARPPESLREYRKIQDTLNPLFHLLLNALPH